MKKFLAVYIGTEAAFEGSGWDKLSPAARMKRELAGLQAWMHWGTDHKKSILDVGTPLGKAKRVSAKGISKTENELVGYE